jgi:hypothetical protein
LKDILVRYCYQNYSERVPSKREKSEVKHRWLVAASQL